MNQKPKLSQAKIASVVQADAIDESGQTRAHGIGGEYPLTLYVDGREIITLMTLGRCPEALALGWLRCQRLVGNIADIEEVRVDWEVNAVAVYTHCGIAALPQKQTVTSGCGQGTMFGNLMDDLMLDNNQHFIRRQKLTRAALFSLLALVRDADTVYKAAGAVHACALAQIDGDSCRVLQFVEDVGRHNAVDAIAGWMWLNDICGDDKIFYTTGRLTSEMVVKCAQIGVPYLVSRSGLTRMGLEIAQKTDMTLFARAINRRYLLFSGNEHFIV